MEHYSKSSNHTERCLKFYNILNILIRHISKQKFIVNILEDSIILKSTLSNERGESYFRISRQDNNLKKGIYTNCYNISYSVKATKENVKDFNKMFEPYKELLNKREGETSFIFKKKTVKILLAIYIYLTANLNNILHKILLEEIPRIKF